MGSAVRMIEFSKIHRFAFAAFLIPLGIQAIPEVLVGTPTRWAGITIAFYVPNTLDWARRRLGWVQLSEPSLLI